MAKLNPTRPKPKKVTEVREVALSKNYNMQFVKPSVQQLFELFTTTMYGKDSFYESSSTLLNRAKAALNQVLADHGAAGAEYVANVILFARKNMNMRTMPLAMTVELGLALRAHSLEKSFTGYRMLVASVISRADELGELYSHAINLFGGRGKLPIALRKGVADAFNKFDAYQLAKYNSGYRNYSLRMVLRDVHPVPTSPEQSNIYDQIMHDTLPPPPTWEVALTRNGMKPLLQRETEKAIWTKLVKVKGPGELGYMALLKNLRNIYSAGVSATTLKSVAAKIRDSKAVASSKQLPWAFIRAFNEAKLAGLPPVLINAIKDAADTSASNIPKLGDRVWVIIDTSSSMKTFDYPTTQQSSTSPIEIASIFAAGIVKANCNSQVAVTRFSDDASFIGLNKHAPLLDLQHEIIKTASGGGTQLDKALKLGSNLPFTPDVVIIISDMQISPFTGNRYPNRYGQILSISPVVNNVIPKDCLKIALNVNSSETTPLDSRDGWHQLVGWSENIFKYVDFKRTGLDIVTRLLPPSLQAKSPTSVKADVKPTVKKQPIKRKPKVEYFVLSAKNNIIVRSGSKAECIEYISAFPKSKRLILLTKNA